MCVCPRVGSVVGNIKCIINRPHGRVPPLPPQERSGGVPLPQTSDLGDPPVTDIWWPTRISDLDPPATSDSGHLSTYRMQTGGTHPTGMLSCSFLEILVPFTPILKTFEFWLFLFNNCFSTCMSTVFCTLFTLSQFFRMWHYLIFKTFCHFYIWCLIAITMTGNNRKIKKCNKF